jgi:hypothetical protein
MTFLPRTVWILFLLCLCSACGQKGRLVMPVRPPPVSTPYPTSVPDDAESDGQNAPTENKKADSASEPASDAKPADVKN